MATKQPSFHESERRAVEDHAMRVFMDPRSTEEDRTAAQRRLLETRRDEFGMDRLTELELKTFMALFDKMDGVQPADQAEDARGRSQSELIAALHLANGAFRDALKHWPGKKAATVEDCPLCGWFGARVPGAGTDDTLRDARALLAHYMRHAQRTWERVVRMCQEAGQAPPSPVYTFKPTTFAGPRDFDELAAPDGAELDENAIDWDALASEEMTKCR